MTDTDIALRCNLVTLSPEDSYEEKSMVDYSSGEITTKEAHRLIETIAAELNSESFSFYSGISYRHCLVWKNGEDGVSFTPPHDISGKKIAPFLPKGEKSDIFISLMKKSEKIFKNHPVNLLREKNGLNPASSIWLWGQGKKPKLDQFSKKYNLTGSVISAVDLIHGIGILAGLKPVHVEGATGNIHTNYIGKAKAALYELENGSDFVYIHVEAPDECGHQGLVKEKIQSIEKIDSELLTPLLEGLAKWNYSILLLPDHPTPISTRTHSREPVPFAIYRSTGSISSGKTPRFTEKDAASTGVFIERGHTLIDRLLV
jgi:2,3-bisphosphoglycerate-independent phosphoglycerate mutase